MRIFIEPVDVLLFRDGRPFSAGEGHRARSLFPPTPNTMQGVVRSKILAERCGRYQQYRDGCLDCTEQENCTIPEEIGRPSQTGVGNYGNLTLKGALIAASYDSDVTSYFRVPADVVQVKNKQNRNAHPQLLSLQPLSAPLPGQNDFDNKLKPLWTGETQPIESVAGYWTQQQLQDYLLAQQPSTFIPTEQLFVKESRFGIEVNNHKQIIEEGKLYQTEFIRCQENVGLYLEVEGIQSLTQVASDQGLVAIGGENKVASYRILENLVSENFLEKLSSRMTHSSGFKLYLATPTKFRGGWLPNWIDPSTLQGTYKGVEVKLIAAAIGRYQTIRGWDIAHNRPKPVSRAVEAGSVYYFTTSASAENIIEAFHWKNLADDPQDAQIGFGLTLVGCWDYFNNFASGEIEE